MSMILEEISQLRIATNEHSCLVKMSKDQCEPPGWLGSLALFTAMSTVSFSSRCSGSRNTGISTALANLRN